jgi:ABC-type nitrate/sulfonate/bicarbonate transport system ATPase subunit
VHHPRLLLLDEPFGALDELTREALWDWLARLLAVTHQTAILVTHNVEEAVALSDRIVILSARPGRIDQILDVSLPRPRSGRLDEAFTREVVRARGALYSAIGSDGVAAP